MDNRPEDFRPTFQGGLFAGQVARTRTLREYVIRQ